MCSHVSKVAQWIYASMVDACVETPYKGTRPITAVTQSRREDMRAGVSLYVYDIECAFRGDTLSGIPRVMFLTR